TPHQRQEAIQRFANGEAQADVARSFNVSQATAARCGWLARWHASPPIIRYLAHADLADCIHHVLALRDQNIDLTQLRDDLFRLVSLPCHCSPPGCQRHTSSRTTSMGVDQRTKRRRLSHPQVRPSAKSAERPTRKSPAGWRG